MAKKQKFSEDLLLEAVVKYADQVRTKIKATELAKWSRNNIPGLEDVRDYHFTRPIKEKDPKTGKQREREKSCTEKIKEINQARSIVLKVKENALLRSSHMEEFFSLPLQLQKKLVVETRSMFDELLKKNGRLTSENEALKKVNEHQKRKIEELSNRMKSFLKNHNILEKRVNYLIRTTDENHRKEMLSRMGVNDGKIDIVQYRKSIGTELEEMFAISNTLDSYENSENSEIWPDNHETPSVREILEGIDFGE